MTKADTIFKENIRKIMEEGVWSEQARPKYKDGRTANSKYITGAFMEFDLAKGEFPITTLRPIAIKSAIKEMLWIYQDQSNSLDVLEEKYSLLERLGSGEFSYHWSTLWGCSQKA